MKNLSKLKRLFLALKSYLKYFLILSKARTTYDICLKEPFPANVSSLKNLYDNMRFNRIDPKKTPIVIQYNKRDLADIESVKELESYLNKEKFQSFEASAITGVGVRETLGASQAKAPLTGGEAFRAIIAPTELQSAAHFI